MLNLLIRNGRIVSGNKQQSYIADLVIKFVKKNILNIMKGPFINIGSDGSAVTFDKKFLKIDPHPRNFGAFSRFLQIVREKQIMSLENRNIQNDSSPC